MTTTERNIDSALTDTCLELLCILAYEKAVEGGDQSVVDQVERAIRKLRTLKIESTGSIPILTPEDIERLEATQPVYDPNHEQVAPCICGHPYHRHFDPYEDWAPVGCKYCPCQVFEDSAKRISILHERLNLAREQYGRSVAKDHLKRKMQEFAVELRYLGQAIAPVPGEEDFK